jgi:hypothetical protein
VTLPEQAGRAVHQAREFLLRLSSPYGEGAIKCIRREIRAEALRLLRHYPYSWNGDYPEPDNAEDGDKVFPEQNVTLTDAEREAVELAYSRLTADTHYASVAATLRGLLERLG